MVVMKGGETVGSVEQTFTGCTKEGTHDVVPWSRLTWSSEWYTEVADRVSDGYEALGGEN